MLIYIVCVLCIVTTYAVIKYFEDRKKFADFYKLNGPRPLPVLGNALLFGSTPKDAFEVQLKLAKNYGEIFRLTMGPQKTVVIYNADHIEKILSSVKYTKKSVNYDFFKNWLGNGLVNSMGNYWKKHRKIITPTFHFKSLQDYATFMAKNLNVLVTILETKTATTIDLNKYIRLYSLDTICDSAMRYDFNAQSQGEDAAYVKALKGYLHVHMIRFFSLFLRSPFVFKNSTLGKEQAAHVECMNSATNAVINARKAERRRAASEGSENAYRSFLDLLLDKQEEEDVMSDEEIREEVATFMFAGHDTVSSSISFCLYELAQHPEIQDELVKESYTVMPTGHTIEVNGGNIASLKHLDCVIKECMRIYTTVPFIERELEEEVVLDGHRLPAGTTVQIMIYMLHHNEKYFPEPEKFDPERFNTENSKARHPYAYIPFSAGPRNCIGFKYGILMTKASVINILRNFKVSRSDDVKHIPDLFNSAILESTNGVQLRLERRK